MNLTAEEINAQMAWFGRHIGAQAEGPAVMSIPPFPGLPEPRRMTESEWLAQNGEWLREELRELF